MTQSAGALSLATATTYDLAGRVRSTISADNLVTTNAYFSGGRIVEQTAPGGMLTRTERHFDGRTRSVTGSGVVDQYTDYGVNEDSTRWTRVSTGPAGSPRWEETTVDGVGRTVRVERPDFTNTQVQIYHYKEQGRLARVQTTGQADTLYAYDEYGNQVRTGQDVDGNGALEPASTDRIADTIRRYTVEEGAWWLASTSQVYAANNSGAATTTAAARQRLNGFSAGVTAEQVSTDIHGNETSATTTLNPQTKTTTRTTEVLRPEF